MMSAQGGRSHHTTVSSSTHDYSTPSIAKNYPTERSSSRLVSKTKHSVNDTSVTMASEDSSTIKVDSATNISSAMNSSVSEYMPSLPTVPSTMSPSPSVHAISTAVTQDLASPPSPTQIIVPPPNATPTYSRGSITLKSNTSLLTAPSPQTSMVDTSDRNEGNTSLSTVVSPQTPREVLTAARNEDILSMTITPPVLPGARDVPATTATTATLHCCSNNTPTNAAQRLVARTPCSRSTRRSLAVHAEATWQEYCEANKHDNDDMTRTPALEKSTNMKWDVTPITSSRRSVTPQSNITTTRRVIKVNKDTLNNSLMEESESDGSVFASRNEAAKDVVISENNTLTAIEQDPECFLTPAAVPFKTHHTPRVSASKLRLSAANTPVETSSSGTSIFVPC